MDFLRTLGYHHSKSLFSPTSAQKSSGNLTAEGLVEEECLEIPMDKAVSTAGDALAGRQPITLSHRRI